MSRTWKNKGKESELNEKLYELGLKILLEAVKEINKEENNED
jgi:hypothetical protein